jgi:hypothetical protein
MANILVETLYESRLKETMTLEQAFDMLLRDDLINTGKLTELAMSNRSGVAMCPPCTPNIDLESGIQVKYATVTRPASSDYYGATVRRQTTAPIALVITNPMEEYKQYFLFIPYRVHSHLSGNTINVPFGRDGLGAVSKWWNYEVDSFDALCALVK